MNPSATTTAQAPIRPTDLLAEARGYYHEARCKLATTYVVDHIIYADPDVTREAAALAFLAALKAIDGYALARGYARAPMSIEEYQEVVSGMPYPLGRIIQVRLGVVYQNLNMLAYQAGGVEVEMIKSGFRRAREIIDAVELHLAGRRASGV
jgi:hypothetical protein